MIGIIDYNMGNSGSVKRKFDRLQSNSFVSNNIAELSKADKLVMPGVGHFGNAIEQIKKLNLWDFINESVLIKKKPILGICLGMQIMAKTSEEGNEEGFGWFDANVIKFKVSDTFQFKIPHIGWNETFIQKKSKLFDNISNNDFYFVHSYHIECNDKQDILTTTNYDYEFVSAIEKDNIFGCQFHPEKSHSQGDQLFKNFIQL
ncbi:imidazole glycerol phosphate synthase subunit HisH [Flavobacterium branchiophilum NBRC 15030 = ATCC 35035]|uniref:Imidazole glycerol phosphate synthase subunit HisH n=1 Tax=Flavobacterium branchiophilum TaxID=55197 RepID=A0A543G636_9FLAO|nr:imidazole glycerol phosphate synthase subunit HisH [Flavobacterium branchiophilum]OXA81122.1 imidazole glycerol phosphate synthase subunit HisH [Flavobacterium branchiophilum NBRC 15030 = ATCC 35035]TQM41548.1 glutamine amidotransferase [Flavobacterium branchiophilum]GEM55130.1 imidazole glycerol phosphate synthase subunit HisH 2 [Flavobacterium branchiophilum NBRC 15030 = ATCC 35035]